MTGKYDLEEVYPCDVGRTFKNKTIGRGKLFCDRETCPYGNGSELTWFSGGRFMVCESGGLIERLPATANVTTTADALKVIPITVHPNFRTRL